MRALSTKETLAVAGAHKKPACTTKPAPTLPKMPAALPKIDIAALIAKLKALHGSLPTIPTAPSAPATETDTSGDTTATDDTAVVDESAAG